MPVAKAWGVFLAVTGFVACPCHFPLTLPLLLGVIGGTGLGGFVASHGGLVYGLATGYFVVALAVGWVLLNRRKRTVASCDVELDRGPGAELRENTRPLPDGEGI